MGRILDGKRNSFNTPGGSGGCGFRGNFRGLAGVEWPAVRAAIAHRISSSRVSCYWIFASFLRMSARLAKKRRGAGVRGSSPIRGNKKPEGPP